VAGSPAGHAVGAGIAQWRLCPKTGWLRRQGGAQPATSARRA